MDLDKIHTGDKVYCHRGSGHDVNSKCNNSKYCKIVYIVQEIFEDTKILGQGYVYVDRPILCAPNTVYKEEEAYRDSTLHKISISWFTKVPIPEVLRKPRLDNIDY